MSEITEVLSGFLHPVIESLMEADMFNKSYQFNADGTQTATGDATFIFSGPPVLNPPTPYKGPFEKYLFPIGALQQYSLNQGTNIVPFGELGSILKRHAVGSGNYGASLGRVENKHSGLKWSMYQWLPLFLKEHKNSSSIEVGIRPGANNNTNNSRESITQLVGLDSDLFSIPFGVLAITGSAGGKLIHVEYLESCYIQSSGRAASAGNPMVMPNISLAVTRVVPFISPSTGKSLLSANEINGYLKNFRTNKNYVV